MSRIRALGKETLRSSRALCPVRTRKEDDCVQSSQRVFSADSGSAGPVILGFQAPER